MPTTTRPTPTDSKTDLSTTLEFEHDIDQQPLFAVYGAGGHGREVMPVAVDQFRNQFQHLNLPLDRLVFVVDSPNEKQINGHQVMSYDKFLNHDATKRFASIAIANSKIRQKIADRFESDGVRHWSLQALNAIVMDSVSIGEGAILSPFVTLTSNINIGRCFHANMYSYVAHDCTIGDYVTFAPSVRCNGNIVVEDHAYIGTGVVIKQGEPGNPLVIGKGAVIGMGAVVTKSVSAGQTVVGNPARPLYKE